MDYSFYTLLVELAIVATFSNYAGNQVMIGNTSQNTLKLATINRPCYDKGHNAYGFLRGSV
jgi:hypothetical protein